MAKIIHASDFCLGRQFSGIGKAGDFVRKAMKESLENSVTLALDRSVDLFLVTGNLFAGNMVSLHLVEFTMRQIERLGKIPFVVIPGTRDSLVENSVYHFLSPENHPENFHLIDCRSTPCMSFPDSGVTVYGMGCVGDEENWALAPVPTKSDLPGVHIVAVCNHQPTRTMTASVAVENVVATLSKSGFDYVALGGEDYKRWNDLAYSSGSPEAQSFENQEAGQVLIIDVNPGSVDDEKVSTGQLVWKGLTLDSTRFRYGIELEEEMLRHASPQTLLRIRFAGDFQPDGYVDLASLESEFGSQFCCLRIEEARNFANGRARIGSADGDNLLADYTYLLEDAIEKATPELRPRYLQALATGNAMLSGKDVIS